MEWWLSIDDGVTYQRMQGSTVAHTTLTGLTPGKIVHLKYQWIIGNTGQGISEPIEKMVRF